ncbi:MAG: hypothetical protein NZV14_18530 [Bryobacteraceae bacterium]|nr:hypothetical protein [Bryobacteraceae bacterium]MDW8380164.1 hypothetical protein [Bryobacterales bacterium]
MHRRLAKLPVWTAMAAVLAMALPLQADAPPKPPATYTVYSNNGKFHAEVNLSRQRTTVYRGSGKTRQTLWSVPGWFRVAAVSDDGNILVTGYDGVNLLPLHFTGEEVLLTFFDRGKVTAKVTVRDLFPDPKQLRRTVSHWAWGDYLGFNAQNQFQVKLVTGSIVTFDPRTGSRLR